MRKIYWRCRGNAVRIKEVLAEEYKHDIGYSTLTRILREAHLRTPPKRVGRFDFAPGEEMQHDTSPHRITLGNRKLTAQCAALYLAYSRLIYVRYYPYWTRFEARCFLSEALAAIGGATDRCIIDNSSVVLAGGSGSQAVIAPEMEQLARNYGFYFKAHRVGDPKRKGGVERVFSYAENNFLAARTFRDWSDLNQQAAQWCTLVNHREKRDLGMSPDAAFLMEKDHLKPLPRFLPPIYQPLARIVDTGGYISLDTNRYSVPEKLIGKRVEVHKYPEKVLIYFGEQQAAAHDRLLERRRGQVTDPNHHAPMAYKRFHSGPSAQEQELRGSSPLLDDYLNGLKKRYRGRALPQIKRLLNLKRTYPEQAFVSALQDAAGYGLFDLGRLEQMILTRVGGDFFRLDLEGDDLCF
jgi:hypothetical protein